MTPASTFSSVVLPQPFSPSRPITCPPASSRSTPASAGIGPKFLFRPRASISGFGLGQTETFHPGYELVRRSRRQVAPEPGNAFRVIGDEPPHRPLRAAQAVTHQLGEGSLDGVRVDPEFDRELPNPGDLLARGPSPDDDPSGELLPELEPYRPAGVEVHDTSFRISVLST